MNLPKAGWMPGRNCMALMVLLTIAGCTLRAQQPADSLGGTEVSPEVPPDLPPDASIEPASASTPVPSPSPAPAPAPLPASASATASTSRNEIYPAPQHSDIREGGVPRIGMFNTPEQPLADEYGSRATRITMTDRQMETALNAFKAGKPNSTVRNIIDFNQSGIAVVVTLAYPGEGNRHRVSVGGDREHVLQTLQDFVENVGPYLTCIAVHNETYIGNSRFRPEEREPDQDGKFPALEWLKEVAATIQQVKAQQPDTLGHLQVASGAFTDLYEYSHSLPARYGDDKSKIGPGPFPRALMEWVQADPNIDMVDVHMHEATPEDCLDVFNYARSFTSRPIIVTEWSPSESKREMLSTTIYAVARAFYDKYQERFMLTPKTTFEQFVRARYTDHCSKEEWDEFVALFDYDPLFWQKSYDLMNDPQMAMLLYGQYLQGATPIYDLKQIVANRTVVAKDGKPQLNYRFGEVFKALTAHVRSLQK